MLHLTDDTGKEKKSIRLDEATERVHPKIPKPKRKVHATLATEGNIAVVTTEEHGLGISTVTTHCYGPDGAVWWERRGVDINRGVHLSDDGNRALLVISNIDGCSSELDVDCTKTAEVLDSSGRAALTLGPYHTISRSQFSRNGRYGFVQAWFGPGKDDVFIFFDIEKKIQLTKKTTELPGSPVLKENGVVEFTKTEYQDLSRDQGKAPRVIRRQVVDRLTIQ